MLYLWMPEAKETWQWSTGEGWQESSSLEDLIQVTQSYHGEEAVVFFPSRNIQLIQQTFNKAQYKQLGAEGVKFLLEEFTVLPIDTMKVLHHFQSPDQLFVMGVSHTAIETMQHALALTPFKIVSLLPDFLVLPQPAENEVIIANLAGRLLVRENEFKGNSIDDLGMYLDYQQKEQNYKISNFTSDQMHSIESIATHEQLESFHYRFTDIKKIKQHPWNVLPKVKTETDISGYWKACIGLLLVGLVVQFSYDAIRWYKIKKVGDQTALQAIDQYKSWFGPNSRITEQNLKSQFESQLRMSQSADLQAIQLLSRIGPVLMQNQITANKVEYEANALQMELKASSAQILQNLAQQLNQQGFKAQLGNVDASDLGAVGIVKIQ